jgi:CheY-like chemotaxis protein
MLDHLMPRLDGEGVLRAVASDRRLTRRHRFILLSAAPRLSLRLTLMRLLRTLAIRRVDKPFDMDELLEAVAQAAASLSGRA